MACPPPSLNPRLPPATICAEKRIFTFPSAAGGPPMCCEPLSLALETFKWRSSTRILHRHVRDCINGVYPCYCTSMCATRLQPALCTHTKSTAS